MVVNTVLSSLSPLLLLSVSLLSSTSIAADRHSKKMPLGDECHDWKKKTTDVKENYDFKDVLGT